MYWPTRTPQLHLMYCGTAPPAYLPGPPKPAQRKGEGEVSPMKKKSVDGERELPDVDEKVCSVTIFPAFSEGKSSHAHSST